jgi:hypothetical protein
MASRMACVRRPSRPVTVNSAPLRTAAAKLSAAWSHSLAAASGAISLQAQSRQYRLTARSNGPPLEWNYAPAVPSSSQCRYHVECG